MLWKCYDRPGTFNPRVLSYSVRNLTSWSINGPHRRHLLGYSIAQDDGIDNFTALHTALCSKLQSAGAAKQVHAEVIIHLCCNDNVRI